MLGFLTTKQFKGKKRTLASDRSGKRNAAKKRRCENQTSTTFPLEAQDKGERYDFAPYHVIREGEDSVFI